MTQETKPTEHKEEQNNKPQDHSGVMMTGHIKIFDPETGEVLVDKRNAIHYENMSQGLANSLANKTTGFIHLATVLTESAFDDGKLSSHYDTYTVATNMQNMSKAVWKVD